MGSKGASRVQQLERGFALREAELQMLLCRPARDTLASDAGSHEVLDFKDVAADASQAAVDEAVAERALRELVDITAASRRLRDGSYGQCLDCGDPIAEQRLLALPSTAYCAPCQAIHERSTFSGHPRRSPSGRAPLAG